MFGDRNGTWPANMLLIGTARTVRHSRVYEVVLRPSVCPIRLPHASAVGSAGRRYRLLHDWQAGSQQQPRVRSGMWQVNTGLSTGVES